MSAYGQGSSILSGNKVLNLDFTQGFKDKTHKAI